MPRATSKNLPSSSAPPRLRRHLLLLPLSLTASKNPFSSFAPSRLRGHLLLLTLTLATSKNLSSSFAPTRLRGHLLLLTLSLTSCSEAPRPGPLAIAELHSGAQEMALDGFQFDKPQLAWPFDSGAPTSAAYLELLQQNNRLAPQTAATLASTSIANLSDSDPAETAFASIPAKDGVIVIRKDGQSRTFPNLAASATFAPPPPRTPAWLP